MINSVMKQEGEEMKNEKPEAVDEHAGIGMNGHILIRDKETGEELVNKRNAIHYGNMANGVANALGGDATATDKIEVIAGSSFTDLKVTCTLGYAEPTDQDLFDSSTNNDGSYVFDELALFSKPTTGVDDITTSKMLTHVVFHPVQKSQNRIIEIIYTVRIQLS